MAVILQVRDWTRHARNPVLVQQSFGMLNGILNRKICAQIPDRYLSLLVTAIKGKTILKMLFYSFDAETIERAKWWYAYK